MKEPVGPARSQSVGSLMELQTPAERRIKELIVDELKSSPKRKLESTISTDKANLLQDGKRKEKIIKENTVADISVCNSNKQQSSNQNELENVEEATPLDRSRTQTLSKDMEVEANSEEVIDPQSQGAACAEMIEEAKKKPQSTLAKSKTNNLTTQVLEDINENPSQENLSTNVDKENLKEKEKIVEKEPETKTTPKKKVVKKVLGVKNENAIKKEKSEETAPVSLQTVLQKVCQIKN